jgi:cellulose synthase/poly-beta-1,6-N-acetylglucosamine synthase-like glycosyltransferase
LKRFPDIYHALIVATYKEDLAVLQATLQAIVNSQYPKEKIILVLATEERDQKRARGNARALKEEFGSVFGQFLVTEHPGDIDGEVKGKGGNITWAARRLQERLQRWQIPYENVIVTTLDADNRPDPLYLAELTYRFLTHPDPIHVSFQPIPMFLNNIWEAPVTSRLMAHQTMFWVMTESTRPWRLRNFSSHSQSMQALIDVDFWATNTIVEDGHQYWRSYFGYNGHYWVEPLYVPIYQDAVVGKSFVDSLRELYLQQRRWAWGVSDLPYIIENCWKNTSVPWWDKWSKAGRAFESHFSWATYSIYLMVAGWIPIMLNSTFSDTVLAYNFPIVASRLLTIALIGLIGNLTIGTLLLASKYSRSQLRYVALEWIFTPIISPIASVIFGSIAALDSQTRLMLGKYLEFRVTNKLRNIEGQALTKTIGV